MSLSNASSNQRNTPNSFVVGPVQNANPVNNETTEGFVDRRTTPSGVASRSERRQFGSSHSGLTDEGHELALAIDQYKVEHHRRYLTCDEMLTVISSLGYRKLTS